jgi:hypothetical protein
MKYSLMLVLVFLGMVTVAQTISRKAVFRKGQQFSRFYTGTVDVVIKVGASEQKTKNSATRLVDISIDEVLDTAYRINSILTHLTQKTEGGGKNQSFDSDDTTGASQGAWAKELRKKAGKTSHIIVNKKGYIVSSDDTTDVKAVTAGLAGNLTSFGDRIGTNYDLIANLPAREIKQGETWVDSTVTKGRRDFTTYTLTAVSPDEAIIDIKGTVASEEETGVGKFKVIVKLSGDGTAKVTFDPVTGILKKMEHDYNTTGIIFSDGTEYPLTIRSVHSVQITAKKL